MTKNELIEIIKNDPRFNLSGRSATITLYESPFEDLRTTGEGEDTILTIKFQGESIELTTADLEDVYVNLDDIGLGTSLAFFAKRISASLSVDLNDIIPRVMLGDDNVTESVVISWEGGEEPV